MATLFAVGIQALVLFIITTISLLMPSLTRRDILFGATVPPNTRATAEGRAVIRRYRIGVLLIAIVQAIGLALLWALAPADFWKSLWIVVIPLTLALSASTSPICWRGARRARCQSPRPPRPRLFRLSRRRGCVHGAMPTMYR